MSLMKAVGAAWNPERHLAWQASQKGSQNHLEAPGGEVWFRKWSEVVVRWGGDLTLISYLESKC